MITKLIPYLALPLITLGCVPAPPVQAIVGQEPAEFTTDVVKRQDLTGYSYFDGKLVIGESAQATAFSPYDRAVEAVMTGAGKYVERGDPIVKLNVPGSEAATTSARAGVSSAQADYSTQKGDSSDFVRQAQRDLAVAHAVEKAARDTVANGGQADIEGATKFRKEAEFVLRQAQIELGHTLQPAKDAVGRANATLRDANADAARGIVRAPITGTVVTFEAQPGMMAKSKQTLATIVNFEVARVQGLVPPELKDLVAKNSQVIISMSGASSNPLDGSVIDVTVVPPNNGQEGPGYLAEIKFLKPRSIAQPSVSVKRIGVKTSMVKNALVIPVGAVNTNGDKTTVSVQSGGKWIETAVVTGVSDGALVEIKSGVEVGAVVRVLLQPRDGQKN
jgi:HlyD family secretion protein